MQINADNKNGNYTLTLSGAPAGSVVEVRFQNTFSGATEVFIADVGSDGKVVLIPPRNFAQNFKVSLAVLTEDNKDNSHDLVFAPVAKDDTSGNFVLVTPDSPLLHPGPAATHVTPPPQHAQ